MRMIKAHFDGQVVVLDEPAMIPVGADVVVIFEEKATVRGSDTMPASLPLRPGGKDGAGTKGKTRPAT